MNKQELSPAEERKIKVAQIGILVAMVLAVALFVGIRVSTHSPTDEPVVSATESVQSRPEAMTRIEEPATVTPASVEEATPAVEVQAQEAQAQEEAARTAQEAAAAPAVEQAPVTYAQAEQTFRSGDYEEAAALFSRYVSDHETNAWGHYMLGLSEARAGDADAAEDAFLHALELKPDHLKSLVNYARVLISQDRNDEARTQLEMALAVNPASIEASRVLGRVQHNQGQLDQAENTYRDILESRVDDVWSLNNLGLVLIQQERFVEALAPLARAAGLDQTMACIQNNLGIALENSGYGEAAGQAYARALECDADYEKASLNLARVQGMSDDALLPAVDLAALAEGFQARPVAVAALDSTVEQEEAPGADMEVASALESSVTTADIPE